MRWRQRTWENFPVDIKNGTTGPAHSVVVILGRAIHPKTIASIGHPPAQPFANKCVERLVDR
jgi:hypothetical protein